MRNLNSPVLILNKSWTAVGTATVRDSLVAMIRGAAAGFCVETYRLFDWEMWVNPEDPPKVSGFVRSTSTNIPAPEVVILTRYDKLRARQSAFDNHGLFIRDGYCCAYCGKKFTYENLTVDHVLPRSRGGGTTWENCVAACVPCNQRKADRTPKEARLALKTRPFQPRWNPVMHISPARMPESWRMLLSRPTG